MRTVVIMGAGGRDFHNFNTVFRNDPGTRVVAISAVRTGAGKSHTSRRVGRILLDAGLRVALVRHPMPYGDLERMRVQRFATLADLDASNPTIEEREETNLRMADVMVINKVDSAEAAAVAAVAANVAAINPRATVIRQARYELRELGHPDLGDVLAPILAAAGPARPVAATS